MIDAAASWHALHSLACVWFLEAWPVRCILYTWHKHKINNNVCLIAVDTPGTLSPLHLSITFHDGVPVPWYPFY